MSVTVTETYNNLYTAALLNARPFIQEAVFSATPFWYWMAKKGGIQLNGSGGRAIELRVENAKNSTTKFFARGGTISTADSEISTILRWDWKYFGGGIYRSLQDDLEAKGPQKLMDMVKMKIDNLKNSMISDLEAALFAAEVGTGDAIAGLQRLVDIDVDRNVTMGGQNPSTAGTWYQNQYQAASGASSIYLLDDMATLDLNCSDSAYGRPTFIVCDKTSYRLYGAEARNQRDVVNKTLGDAEFEHLVYGGRPIFWSSSCPSGYMYFLNEKFLTLEIDPQANFALTPWKENFANGDKVAQMYIKLALILNRRPSLGVMAGISAT